MAFDDIPGEIAHERRVLSGGNLFLASSVNNTEEASGGCKLMTRRLYVLLRSHRQTCNFPIMYATACRLEENNKEIVARSLALVPFSHSVQRRCRPRFVIPCVASWREFAA